jgi:hypothetical protein
VRKFGVDVNARSLVRVDDESKFETITGDPGDGQSPSCSIHDEYHEHADDGQVDTMQTGMGARDQPLQVLITTAGDNLAGPCYAASTTSGRSWRHRQGRRAADRRRDLLRRVHDRQGRRLEVGSGAAQGQPELRRLRRRRLPAGPAARRDRDAAQGRRVQDEAPQPVGGSAKAAWFDVEAWRRCHDPTIPIKASTRPCSSGCAAAAASPGSTSRRRSTSRRSSC